MSVTLERNVTPNETVMDASLGKAEFILSACFAGSRRAGMTRERARAVLYSTRQWIGLKLPPFDASAEHAVNPMTRSIFASNVT
jgi:hypothetical protein